METEPPQEQLEPEDQREAKEEGLERGGAETPPKPGGGKERDADDGRD